MLVALEVGLLYIVLAVETPLTPVVQRLMRNPAGVFTLVMSVVLVLILGMAGFIATIQWLNRRDARRQGAPRP